ncbi:fructosamine kinase family protein [Companilactobacillus halodurans]|uniref:Fructosamine kinase family protein n=1 Tax=Companilactobacillus halodurans TaxID=2584183 RepID=A0A5P0ZWG1_9LACO|nr:fructosamine kinase family protein [Companilactobacillus halodurans]MQS97245.1 fructosamine kinase family protein [Companilactobacillus halodurans]
MQIDKSWYDELNLGDIKQVQPVSGGDINLAFKITTAQKNYFLKVQPKNDQSFFGHEIEGLNLINSVANAPQVIKSGTFKNNGYLILNYIEFGTGSQFDLGKLVAQMHQKHASKFGLNHDVLNAKNKKINTWQDNWADFYINQRLEVLIKQVKQKNNWNGFRDKLMKQFEEMIREYYSKNPITPSLLHGDLWNGNASFQDDHQPILYDPDVFFGNREMDIAMTLLFGGFSEEFYRGYNDTYPMADNWQKRVPWYQTYYLLAHLNLFGETYGPSLENALMKSLEK